MSVTQKIVEEVTVTKFNDLPSSTVTVLKQAIMDHIGVAFFGYQHLHKKPLIEFAKAIGGLPESTIIGAGIKVSCGLAAGINAVLVADTEFEETGPGVHAFHTIEKTAIAVGERTSASGKDILTAIAIAYELCGRFIRSIKAPRSFIIFSSEERRHLTLLSAVCAAKILGLSAEEINRAIGTAWRTYAPPPFGLNLGVIGGYFQERVRPCYWSCQCGIHAALLAQFCGWGPLDILDKKAADIYKLEDLLFSPSAFYSVDNELCLKPWIGCYPSHGGLGIVADIMQKKGLNPDDIEQIIFQMSVEFAGDPMFSHGTEPKDFFDAANSVPWSVANIVLGHEPGPDWVNAEALKDPRRINMAKKVKVTAGQPDINAIELIAKGEVYRDRVAWKDFPGGPNRRMTSEQTEAKFTRLVSPVVGAKQTRTMIDICRNLEQLDNVQELTRYFGVVR